MSTLQPNLLRSPPPRHITYFCHPFLLHRRGLPLHNLFVPRVRLRTTGRIYSLFMLSKVMLYRSVTLAYSLSTEMNSSLSQF